eukprot:m.231184 g.231184  ORF g.231184 m.231184 type:complete len:915 (-) comp18276_c0_seq1:117-2861(-)
MVFRSILVVCACVALIRAQQPPANFFPLKIFTCYDQPGGQLSSKPYQQWEYKSADQTIRLLNFPDICIDIDGYGTQDDASLQTFSCHTDDKDPTHQNQEWRLTADGHIVSTMSGRCIDVANFANVSGSRVHLWDVLPDNTLGNQNQRWVWNADNTVRGLMSGLCLDGGTITDCFHAPFSSYPWCNISLDAPTRARALVAAMTLDEKAVNLQNSNPGVARLGAPINPFSEALHGVLVGCGKSSGPDSTGCPTSFPHALALGATFNRSLWRAVGSAITTEARALNNQGIAGLFYWAPDINLFRDPRWGRGQEVPGEDPFLTGEYVMHYTRGFQEGPDSRYLKAVSTAKHYCDYDCENCNGTDRGSFDAQVNDRDQVEYYWPQWRAAVEGAHVQSVMCSYNAVNGMPSCGNDLFINGVMRNQWQFDGFVVSDCGAIADGAFTRYIHKHYPGPQQDLYQARQGIAGGCDVNCGSFYSQHIADAVTAGVLDESLVDQAAVRLFTHSIQLGMYDPNVEYRTWGPDQVDTAEHRELALAAARAALVLLKNDNQLLPLKSKNIAVIGPHATATQDMLSNYYGTNTLVNSHSPLAVLQARASVKYAAGLDSIESTNTSGFAAATAAARASDVAVVFVGIHQQQESEGLDRVTLTLPGAQEALVRAVLGANPNTVLVLINGGPLAIDTLKKSVPAILEAWYPGELGGDAIADILYGVVSPAGRLPTTIYPSSFINVRPITNMDLRAAGGITYRHYTGTPLWPFGFGLSYTTFRFVPLQSVVTVTTAQMAEHHAIYYRTRGTQSSPAAYQVNVTNTGSVDSDVVVLGFINSTDPDSPLSELFDFARVFVKVGQTVTVTLSVSPQVLSLVDSKGNERLQPGPYSVSFGVDGAAEGHAAQATLRATGETKMLFEYEAIKRTWAARVA